MKVEGDSKEKELLANVYENIFMHRCYFTNSIMKILLLFQLAA